MTVTATTRALTSTEVIAVLGVSYRQLHHWVTRGWIPDLHPLGSGASPDRQWAWTPEQVNAARHIRDHLDHARQLLADPTRCPARCPCWGGSP